MAGYEEMVHGLHADVVHKTFPGDLVVGVEDVVEIVDCVLEIAARSDALVENGVQFDHFSLVRVRCTHCGFSVALSRQNI